MTLWFSLCEGGRSPAMAVVPPSVITLIRPKKQSTSFPGDGEQLNERPELLVGHVSELSLMNRRDGFLERIEESQAGGGNPRGHQAPVGGRAFAGDQPPLLHSVEQARHVWHLRYEPVADLVPAKPLLTRPAEDAQHVVLRPCDPELLQRISERVPEHRRCSNDAEMRFLAHAAKGLFLLELDA